MAAIIAPNAFNAIEKAKISRVISDLNAIKAASLIYYSDIGFWPPDVLPPVDPGFMQPLPYDPVTGGEYTPTSAESSHLPADWKDVVNKEWDGPYLEKWPLTHPWGSSYTGSYAARQSYDYEYWDPNRGLPFNGIAVSIRNLPERVYNRLLRLDDEGKFPYPLVDTTLGGYYSIAALVYEINE